MNIAFDCDGHVRMSLGLYFVGGLTDDEQAAVERHLAACESCLAEYDDVGEAALYLSALDESDADTFSEQGVATLRCDDLLRTGDPGAPLP
jgi:predicted anti-sigma-YlaC factor YlaD